MGKYQKKTIHFEKENKMNNREIKWEIKKVAPGMVKIEANPLGRMPTFD